MIFFKRLISRNSKAINLEDVVVNEDLKKDVSSLKKGSSALVEIEVIATGIMPIGKYKVSEDVAIILINSNRAILCQ